VKHWSIGMRVALQEARASLAEGNKPFGAVLCSPEGDIILRAQSTVPCSRDPTCRPEMLLVSQACREFDKATLAEASLTQQQSTTVPLTVSMILGNGSDDHGAVPNVRGGHLLGRDEKSSVRLQWLQAIPRHTIPLAFLRCSSLQFRLGEISGEATVPLEQGCSPDTAPRPSLTTVSIGRS
jgi:hypothetical protein